MDLNPIELVLMAPITGVGVDRAGIGIGRHRPHTCSEPAPIGGLQGIAEICRRHAGIPVLRQNSHLPYDLRAGRSIGTVESDFSDRIVLDVGDEPLPDVKIYLPSAPSLKLPGVPSPK